jgi:cytoskeletal protein CcmA (bactofilin family)
MGMLGKREETGPRLNAADAHTILGREAKFHGKLVFEGAVRIDGRFEGEIRTEDLLLIGPGAEVKGTLHVGTVVINGLVEGEIVAKAAIELRAPGRLRGSVTTPALVIEKGSTFDGTSRMAEAPAVQAEKAAG